MKKIKKTKAMGRIKTETIIQGKQMYSGVFIDHSLGLERAKKRYGERRKKLLASLSYPTVIFGVNQGPGGNNVWPYIHVPIYQEPLMLYLTGINQLHVALYLNPGMKEREILFVGKKDPKFEFWQGTRLGVGDEDSLQAVRDVTGIEAVQDIAELDSFVRLDKKKPVVGLYWYESQKKKKIHDSNHEQNQQLLRRQKKNHKKIEVMNIAEKVWNLRLPLDKTDIANARKANVKTGEAFKTVLPQVSSFTHEYALCGTLDGELRKRTPYGQAFPTIAASGRNATILHYEKANDKIGKNDLFLIDFGLRWGSMHADISRTFPVSGSFNPLQALLYEIVLMAQVMVEKAAKPGVTIAQLNEICWGCINTELQKKILDRGGNMKLPYEKQPHGVSHLMGEMEHDGDPFGEYKKTPMQVGWMLSNEPGVYGDFEVKLDGVKYKESIGIRIEDNLVITEKGCVNLSSGIPKKIKDLEALID